MDKRGAMSDTAYARSVLRELGNAQDIVVINDEAHHAWRVPPGAQSVSAALLDHLGLLGATVRVLDPARLLGIVVLFTGTWIIMR